MEERRYYSCGYYAFASVFILALPATFLFLNSNDFWEVGGAILLPKLIFGNHTYNSSVRSNNNNININLFANEIGPNLTSCHDSYGRPDLLINCCPPLPDENEVAVEYEFPDPSKTPLRIRRPLHKVGPEVLAKYTKALNIMQSLPHTDPRSYSRQAIVHCTFCSGAFDMKYYLNLGNASKPPSNNININIHRQWMFYPFHRMYMYFHERILGSLIGDETFAVPYWNWDNPDAMFFPDLFLSPPFNDTQRDASHFSPAVIDLNFSGPKNGTVTAAEQRAANLALMYNQVVSAGKRTELFMGCRLLPGEEGFCDGPGTVEMAPHNHVHSWVGSDKRKGRENMGSFYSAAWDPSFYFHHSNIDRIWELWRDVHGVDVPILDPIWLNSYFYFYDENVRLVKIKVSDVLNITKLGYGYEKSDLVWLNHRPKPSVDPKIAKVELGKRDQGRNVNGVKSNANVGQSSLSSPIRVKVFRPKRLRTVREKKEEEEVLVVYGIKAEGHVDGLVKFDVYVNLIDETKLGPSYREFVGTYVNLHQGKSRRTGGTLKLGISEALEDLEADEDESIWVTLFPMTSSCQSVIIGGIRIEYMR